MSAYWVVSVLVAVVAVVTTAMVIYRRFSQGWLVCTRSTGWSWIRTDADAVQWLHDHDVDLRDYNVIHGLIVPPGGFPQTGSAAPGTYPDAKADDIVSEYTSRLRRGYCLLGQSNVGEWTVLPGRKTRNGYQFEWFGGKKTLLQEEVQVA
jgi:hypothetical protein